MFAQAHQLLGMTAAVAGRKLTKYEQMKFVLNTVAPAIIQPEEADRLIDYVVDESQLFKLASVEKMDTNEKDIRFIDITGGILRQLQCGASCTESVSITNTNKCLRTISLDAKVYLCDTDLEDGITGAQLEQQVLGMAARQIANELEIIALMGNTNGSYTDPANVNNGVMGLRDMWYRQLQQGHVLDANTLDTPATRQLTFHKMTCMLRAIPTKFRQTPEALRIFMPSDMWFDYAELHQGRATALGDRAFHGPLEPKHLTTPIVPVALMPTNLQRCGCTSLGSATGTYMFASDPSNLVIGMERNITFERDRIACEHRTWMIWTIRFDALIFNEDATSLVDCMQLASCGTGCAATALPAGRCYSCISTGSGDSRVYAQ